MDWDIAGAAAILAECGVRFEDACTGTMRLNLTEIRHGALAAFAAGLAKRRTRRGT